MTDEYCIICGLPATDWAHWPRTRRFGNAVVPLCRSCHTAQHWGKQYIVEQLITRAPIYWRKTGQWEMYADEFETWCSKRRFKGGEW